MRHDQFIWIFGKETTVFVNVDHIASAAIDPETGALVLRLSNNSTFEVQGNGRLELLKLMMQHSVMTNGEKIPENVLRNALAGVDRAVRSES